MPLVFATGNKHKFAEISKVLEEYDITLVQEKMELTEPCSDSLKEIALEKAKQAFGKVKGPVIVDDTGFYLEAYPGFPGTNPKWVIDRLGFEGILKLLSGKSRKAHFETVICFMESGNMHRFFEGKLFGRISKKVVKPKANTMPYNKIFIPEGEKRTLCEMKENERISMLQRTIAVKKLAEWLKERSLHELIESI